MNALEQYQTISQDITQNVTMDRRDAQVASQVKVLPATAAQAEIASYIAQMAGELALLASSAKFELLAYFLDMARVESELIAHKRGQLQP